MVKLNSFIRILLLEATFGTIGVKYRRYWWKKVDFNNIGQIKKFNFLSQHLAYKRYVSDNIEREPS